jgi:Ser/Thr protein kinase RdoA (MazF antagonist)
MTVTSNDQWGKETEFFYELTPDRILDAVEETGLRCTGRCLTLYAMENRVYEVEIEVDDPKALPNVSDRFRVAKFYRPGRWSKEQIEEEHAFLRELKAADIPVVAPVPLADGSTVGTMPGSGIFFAIFPRQGGRSPDEFTDDQLERIGRLLARVHAVGAERPAKHRLSLTPESYGLKNLEFLRASRSLPNEVEYQYVKVVEELVKEITPLFKGIKTQRIHGDCHVGNLLANDHGLFLIDFDDMVAGPCVQDLWLLIPGQDQEARAQHEMLLDGYTQMRRFDRKELQLIEPLRALRFVHFAAWIAKRWTDPAFPRAFPQFGTVAYWQGQVGDLQMQLQKIREGGFPPQSPIY